MRRPWGGDPTCLQPVSEDVSTLSDGDILWNSFQRDRILMVKKSMENISGGISERIPRSA